MQNKTDTVTQHSDDGLRVPEYRAHLYRIASQVFLSEPTEHDLISLIALASKTGEEDRESSCASKAAKKDRKGSCEDIILSHLRSYAGKDTTSLRRAIATEYAELFIGPRPPLAPLYESVYREPSRRLYGDTTMQVRAFYERFGFAVHKRNRVPDDHLAYELEFLYRLCEREVQAAARHDKRGIYEARQAQLAFINAHLGQWIGQFVEGVSSACCAQYYKAWARFAQAFIAEDRQYLWLSLKGFDTGGRRAG